MSSLDLTLTGTTLTANVFPSTDGVHQLGSDTAKWATVTTNDLVVCQDATIEGDTFLGGNLTVVGEVVSNIMTTGGLEIMDGVLELNCNTIGNVGNLYVQNVHGKDSPFFVHDTFTMVDNGGDTGKIIFDGGIEIGSGTTTSTTDSVAVGKGALATGTNTVVMGRAASDNSNADAVVIGDGANTSGTGGVVIGQGGTSTGGVAVGDGANGGDANSVAVGRAAASTGAGAVSLGQGVAGRGDNSVNIGTGAQTFASGDNGVAIGAGAIVSNSGSVAIGQGAVTSPSDAVAVGRNAQVSVQDGLALGRDTLAGSSFRGVALRCPTNSVQIINGIQALQCTVNGTNREIPLEVVDALTIDGGQLDLDCNTIGNVGNLYVENVYDKEGSLINVHDPINIVDNGVGGNIFFEGGIQIGDASTSTDSTGVAIGKGATSSGLGVAIGNGASAGPNSSVAIRGTAGDNSLAIRGTAAGDESVAINATATGTRSVAIGSSVTASARSVALGVFTTANGSHSCALGYNVTQTSGYNTIGIGGRFNSVSDGFSITVGAFCSASGGSIAIGGASPMNGGGPTASNQSIAMGASSTATGTQSIALGVDSTSIATRSVALGQNTNALADHCVAIGECNNANGDSSIAIGYNVHTGDGGFCIAIGRNTGNASTGIYNTLIGTDAGCDLSSGERNICVGTNSGESITTGSRNITVGDNAGASMSVSDSVAIGSFALATADHQIRLGAPNPMSITADARAWNHKFQDRAWNDGTDTRLAIITTTGNIEKEAGGADITLDSDNFVITGNLEVMGNIIGFTGGGGGLQIVDGQLDLDCADIGNVMNLTVESMNSKSGGNITINSSVDIDPAETLYVSTISGHSPISILDDLAITSNTRVAFDDSILIGEGTVGQPASFGWVAETAPAIPYQSSLWAPGISGGIFVIGSTNGSNSIAISADGSTWLGPQTTPGPASGIGYSPTAGAGSTPLLVAGGLNSLMTSPDGTTWTARTTPAGAPGSSIWGAIAWSPSLNLFAIGSNTAALATSPDGINWTLRTSPPGTQTISRLIWVESFGLFVGTQFVGSLPSGMGHIIHSPDGINWTRTTITSGVPATNWFDFAYSPTLDRLVMVASFGPSVATTSDPSNGAAWTLQTPAVGCGQQIVWAENRSLFVCVRSNSYATSPDAVTWTSQGAHALTSNVALSYSPQLDCMVGAGFNAGAVQSGCFIGGVNQIAIGLNAVAMTDCSIALGTGATANVASRALALNINSASVNTLNPDMPFLQCKVNDVNREIPLSVSNFLTIENGEIDVDCNDFANVANMTIESMEPKDMSGNITVNGNLDISPDSQLFVSTISGHSPVTVIDNLIIQDGSKLITNTLEGIDVVTTGILSYTDADTTSFADTGLTQVDDFKYIDATDDLVMIGFFTNSITLGSTTLNAAGPNDLFVTKYNVGTQTYTWATQAGVTAGALLSLAVDYDDNGDIYIIANTGFGGATSFQPPGIGSPIMTSFAQPVVAKVNSAGVWQWVTPASGVTADIANFTQLGSGRFCERTTGTCFVAGPYDSTITFAGVLNPVAMTDIYIAKIDTNGNWLTQITCGGSGNDGIYRPCFDIDEAGNFLIGGVYTGGASTFFNALGPLSTPGSFAFVAKFDSSLNTQWVASAAVATSTGLSLITGISHDASNNYYVTGEFDPTITFPGQPTLTNDGSLRTPCFAKFDSAGTCEWSYAVQGGDGRGWTGITDLSDSSTLFVFQLSDNSSTYTLGSLVIGNPATDGEQILARVSSAGNWEYFLQDGTGGSLGGLNTQGFTANASKTKYWTSFRLNSNPPVDFVGGTFTVPVLRGAWLEISAETATQIGVNSNLEFEYGMLGNLRSVEVDCIMSTTGNLAIEAAGNVTIQGEVLDLTGASDGQVMTYSDISGWAPATSAGLPPSGVTPGTYGTTMIPARVTVNSTGIVTSIDNTTLTRPVMTLRISTNALVSNVGPNNVVPFNAVSVNTGGMIAANLGSANTSSPAQIIVPVSGNYLITAHITCDKETTMDLIIGSGITARTSACDGNADEGIVTFSYAIPISAGIGVSVRNIRENNVTVAGLTGVGGLGLRGSFITVTQIS